MTRKHSAGSAGETGPQGAAGAQGPAGADGADATPLWAVGELQVRDGVPPRPVLLHDSHATGITLRPGTANYLVTFDRPIDKCAVVAGAHTAGVIASASVADHTNQVEVKLRKVENGTTHPVTFPFSLTVSC